MQITNIFYPHRIPFANIGNCDVCSSPGKKVYSLPFSKYLGLVCCNNKNCRNALKISMQKTTIPLEEITKKYGKTIKVKRSNGNKEDGWKIISYAYKRENNLDFWVHVSKDKKIKCVKLSDLL